MSDEEKMLSGQLYDGYSEEVVKKRKRAQILLQKIRDCQLEDTDQKMQLYNDLFYMVGDKLNLISPFYCNFGNHISLGNNVFINYNCTILDNGFVTIGDDVLIGPNVQLLTVEHPHDPWERKEGKEYANPICICDNVWIGGGSIICSGVTIGKNSIIGAGSIVVKNIPENVVAVGNPCQVIKNL